MMKKYIFNLFKAGVVITVVLALIMPGSAVVANFDTTGNVQTSVNTLENGEIICESVYKPVEAGREDDMKDWVKINAFEEDVSEGIDVEEEADFFEFNIDYSLCKQPVLFAGEPRLSGNTPPPSREGRKTIYVDDDFEDDPPNHKWDTIQEGVDDAENGDTVRVYDGVYYENVVVDKSIDLIGNGSTTIVDGGNIDGIDALLVVANWVNMSGFGIRNAGDDGIELASQNNYIFECEIYESLVGIFVYYADYNTIESCMCYDNSYGIYFYESAFGETKNCICHNNLAVGIFFDDSDDADISWCTVITCDYGIRIEGSDDASMNNCTVTGNGNGTFLYNSENCVLRDNQQFNNMYNFGIYGDYIQDIDMSNTVNGKPIYHVMSQNDLVFDDTMDIGYLCFVSCDNVTLRNLDLSHNMYGIEFIETTNSLITNCSISFMWHSGIWNYKSSGNQIDNCTIIDVPGYAGVALFYSTSENNLVVDCEVYNHGHFGIYSAAEDNNITRCSVHDGVYGIYISLRGVIIRECQVWNNSDKAIYIGSPKYGTFLLRDNVIWNNVQNFGILPSSVSGLLAVDVDTSNTVNGKPIYYLRNAVDLELNETIDVGWVGLVSCSNITVRNLHFPGFYDGMLLSDSDCRIINCSVSSCHYGFLFYESDYEVTLEDCSAYDNYIATQLQKSEGNNITGYHAYGNTFGLWIHSDSANNILRDCNLHDNTYNFACRGSDAGDFYHDIDTSNLVNGKPMYYIIGQNNLIFNETMDIGFLGLVSCENILVENLEINNNDYGVLFADTINSSIISCSFGTHYISAIYLAFGSNNNYVEDCTVYDASYGISFYYATDGNTIEGCTAYETGLGIRAYRDDTNHVIANCTFYNNDEGVYLYSNADYNTIINCIAYDNSYGFDIYRGDYNNITNCQVYDNEYGIDLYDTVTHNQVENSSIFNNSVVGVRCYKCTDGTVMNNMFHDNYYGIYVYTSSNDNLFYHNNFVNNIQHAYDKCINIWDNGYPVGGNYWDDYTGEDNFSGPGQNIPGSDGIGDTPYAIPGGGNVDNYPFMKLGGWDVEPPTVDIVKPVSGLYIFNRLIIPLPTSIFVFGKLTVEVDAEDEDSGIARVEFYVDDDLVATDETGPSPYTWKWDILSFFEEHTLKVVGYDRAGNNATSEVTLWVLYLGF